MSQAEEAVDSLRNGPSAKALERMASTGFLTGAQLSYFGDSYPGMRPNGTPSQDDPPSTVNAWWTSMSEKEQQQAIEDHPELLRALDGIPSTVRDKLNKDYLGEEITRLEEEIEELEQENEVREPIPSYPSDESVKEIKTDKLQEQLDILIQLEFDLDEAGPTHHEERFPLSLGSDAQGRAIVAHRNPDTADNVATLVPGTTTDWQSIEEQANRGQNLAEVAHRVDENADHSVISWIGYDAPNM